MPSGAYITAEYACFGPTDCYLNINVYPLAGDFGHSEGLCGNYNGIADDDLTIKGTTTVDNTEEPVAFATRYV